MVLVILWSSLGGVPLVTGRAAYVVLHVGHRQAGHCDGGVLHLDRDVRVLGGAARWFLHPDRDVQFSAWCSRWTSSAG